MKKKNNILQATGLLIASLLLMGACSSDNAINDNNEEVVVKGKDQNTTGKIDVPITPGVVDLSDGERQMVAQGNAFAFNLMRQIDQNSQGSYILCPLSVGYVLGMLNEAADDESRKEIMQVLGFGEATPQDVSEYYGNMLYNLPGLEEEVTLETANILFGNSGLGISFSNDFTARMQGFYQAGIESIDFSKTADALASINGWCKEHTHGMIPEILSGGELNANAVACLLNAIYMSAHWMCPFTFTKEENFVNEDGQNVKVPMMRKGEERMDYMDDDELQAISMPMGIGTHFRMAILLPAYHRAVSNLSKSLTAERWNQIESSMSSELVYVKMPRFSVKSEHQLKETLQGMGMKHTFTKGNFSTMLSNPSLPVNFDLVKQKACIDVNEEGVSAAAVTFASSQGVDFSEKPKPKYFYATSPFIFLLYEKTTGAILFMGKYSGD